MLIRCLRISSETHYFSPKWNFSWKAIKIEGIKIFTRLIRLHASSGLIHHKQENNKRHLNREFLPEVFSTHHKTLEDDKEEIGISRAYKLALTHILCIQGGRKLEGYEGLHKQVLCIKAMATNAARRTGVHISFKLVLLLFSDIYPRVKLLSHIVFLVFWGSSILFSTTAAPIYISDIGRLPFLYIPTNMCYLPFWW